MLMSAALTLGEPEWWTGPEQTGSQLLEDGTFAAEFVAEETFADIREIRRIIFQMLGMDHLVFFIDACCSYLRIDVDAIVSVEERTKEMKTMVKAMNAAAKAKKQDIFDDANIRRLLYFALECGLDLGPTACHVTPFAFRKYKIAHFSVSGINLRAFKRRLTVTTVEMLTKLQMHHKHINGTVTRAVLDSTTFNAGPIFDECGIIVHPRTRLYSNDSGSAVWFEILDVLFAYHQSASPSNTFNIMSKCLHEVKGHATLFTQLITANRCDKQRRMLPWLLRKPDWSDGAHIIVFYRAVADVNRIFACADLCKDHPDWRHTCVRLINMFVARKHFIANVRRLPGMAHMTLADIGNYVLANIQRARRLPIVCSIRCNLMQFIVKHATFDTVSSVDRVFAWGISYSDSIMLVFAQRLFLIQTVAQRAVTYKRFLAVIYVGHSTCDSRLGEIIYYLMHGEESFGTYTQTHHSSLLLVEDMLKLGLDDRAIAHIISATHTQDVSNMSYLIIKLCERKLRFDLLLRLLDRYCRIDANAAKYWIKLLKESADYEPDQTQTLIAHIR